MEATRGRIFGQWLFAIAFVVLSSLSASARAQAERAMTALEQKDCDGAIDALNRGMTDGETRSMFLVGQMFESGICVKVDPARAAALYEKGGSRGDVASARSLALLDARGLGVPQSYAKAGYWFAVARGLKPESQDAFATPEDIARTYVEAVHDLAEDTMVYPAQASAQGVRGNVVMRFDPRSGTASLVSFIDDQSTAINHLGPSKHLFERALASSYELAIRTLPKPELPAVGDFATVATVRFSRDRNNRGGPFDVQGLRR